MNIEAPNKKRVATAEEIADKAKCLIKKISRVINEGNYEIGVTYIALNKLVLEVDEKYSTHPGIIELQKLTNYARIGLTEPVKEVQ